MNRGDLMAIKKKDVGVIEEVSEVTSSQKFKIKDLLKKSKVILFPSVKVWYKIL